MKDGRWSVMVVDDEQVVLQVARRMLERLGYEPISASSGAEAVELFRERSGEIDCAIVDAFMGGLSGLQTLQRLRRIRPQIPVIISSGLSMEEVEERFGGSEGPVGFLRKPYHLAALAEALRQIRDSPADQRE